MKAAVMKGIKEIQILDYPMPVVGEGDVLVKVKYCGVCGSDLHYYEFGRIADYIVNKPFILGHECSGEVVSFGKAVTGFKVGDLVAIEPGYTCGKCNYCKSGHYNLCEKVVFMATPPYDGAFCEYVSYPSDVVFKLPEGMDAIEGALLEPLNVGFYAAQQGGASVGKSAVVLGSGCIGLCTLMALNSMGVKNVTVVDIMDNRLDIAKRIGAENVVNGKREDVVSRIMDITEGKGADIVFETAGAVGTGQETVEIATRGGTIVMVGMAPSAKYEYNFGKFIDHELTMKSVFRYRNLYPVTIDAVKRLKLPLKDIVTNIYDIDHVKEGMDFSIEHKDQSVKTVICVSK